MPISAAVPTAAIPISMADPKQSYSSSPTFHGDSWSPMPSDVRNKPSDTNMTVSTTTDINVTVPGG